MNLLSLVRLYFLLLGYKIKELHEQYYQTKTVIKLPPMKPLMSCRKG